MWFRDFFNMLWSLNHTGFSLCFLTLGFNRTKVLFQIGEGYAAIQKGGGLPVWGGGGSLMTHSAGSVTNQSTVQHSNM
jgi:hypothetical protein